MQVHQPFYMGLAFFGLLPCLMMIGVIIYSLRSQKATERRLWWTCLVYASAYALLAGGWFSKAYDFPHRTSSRSEALELGAVVVLWLAFAFWLFSRGRQKRIDHAKPPAT